MQEERKIWTGVEGLLQAFAVWLYTFIFLFLGPLAFLASVYLLLCTRYWFTVVLYFTWVYLDRQTPRTGGRRSEAVRSLRIWKYFVDYFPLRAMKVVDLDPEKNYLMIVHPHGIITYFGAGSALNSRSNLEELYPNHAFFPGTLDFIFYLPVIREFLLAIGLISVSRESLLNMLRSKKKGKVVSIVVGGAAEALLSRPGSNRLVLKNRMGFVKVALMAGVPLLPCYGFGEVDLYDQIDSPPGSRLQRFQKWFHRKTGVGLCTPRGRGPLKMLPHKKPLFAIIGEPLEVPEIPNPTDEDVRHYHKLYIEKLTKLFNDNKQKYAPESSELIIE